MNWKLAIKNILLLLFVSTILFLIAFESSLYFRAKPKNKNNKYIYGIYWPDSGIDKLEMSVIGTDESFNDPYIVEFCGEKQKELDRVKIYHTENGRYPNNIEKIFVEGELEEIPEGSRFSTKRTGYRGTNKDGRQESVIIEQRFYVHHVRVLLVCYTAYLDTSERDFSSTRLK
jgi:hypothetical protein